jgi:hypothetical protein
MMDREPCTSQKCPKQLKSSKFAVRCRFLCIFVKNCLRHSTAVVASGYQPPGGSGAEGRASPTPDFPSLWLASGPPATRCGVPNILLFDP